MAGILTEFAMRVEKYPTVSHELMNEILTMDKHHLYLVKRIQINRTV